MLPARITSAVSENWLVLGDSVSKGIVYDESRGHYEPLRENFIALAAAACGASVKNYSIFGATVTKGLEVWARHEAKLPDEGLCFLEFGGNDCDYLWQAISEKPDIFHDPNTPPERFTALYRELIAQIQNRGWTPVILSLPPLEEDRYFETLSRGLDKDNIMRWLSGTTKTIYRWQESYNAALPGIAEATGAAFVDIRRPFLMRRHPENYICADGIHPNAAGHELIAETFIKAFEGFLCPAEECVSA